MTEPYTIAFAGFGYMGLRLLEGFLEYRKEVQGSFQITGFRLVRESTTKKVRAIYPDMIKADTYEDLFAGRTVSDVVIASPTEQHIPQATFAIEQGAGVFLEKPISTDLREAETFVDFVLDHNSIVFIDYIEDALPISQLRDALLFGELHEAVRLIPRSFIALRTKDRENPDIEKNWRDFDHIAGRDSIHCLFKILKILSKTSDDEPVLLPRSVKAVSKELIHPDPAFPKRISGQIVGELAFDGDIRVQILTSALSEHRRGFTVPACLDLSQAEQEEAKVQHISCVDPDGKPAVLLLNFIRNTFDVWGVDTDVIEAYLKRRGFHPRTSEVEIEGKPFRRYVFGDTNIDTWVMRTYFGLKALKTHRSVRDINRDIALCTVTAGYYTQLWAELLQQSVDRGGRILHAAYVRRRNVYGLREFRPDISGDR